MQKCYEVLHVKNKRGMTASEKISIDLEIAKSVKDDEHRHLLANMVIAAAELAVDFDLITYREWGTLTREAFDIM